MNTYDKMSEIDKNSEIVRVCRIGRIDRMKKIRKRTRSSGRTYSVETAEFCDNDAFNVGEYKKASQLLTLRKRVLTRKLPKINRLKKTDLRKRVLTRKLPQINQFKRIDKNKIIKETQFQKIKRKKYKHLSTTNLIDMVIFFSEELDNKKWVEKRFESMENKHKKYSETEVMLRLKITSLDNEINQLTLENKNLSSKLIQ
jgi:hypothetical protein